MERQFLWGGPNPRPIVGEFSPRAKRWWVQYASSQKLSQHGLSELHRTSTDIVALLPDPTAWYQAPRPFRGLVVGAVQSGKTSSMIGVSAIALDQGYKLVVVLAGGKDDLRQQTARRFNSQLVVQRDDIPGMSNAYTLSPDVIERPNGGIGLPFSVDIHQWAPGFIRIRQCLKKGEPCVFVIKKNLASLAMMRQYLGRAYDEFGERNLPTLILDDECDDASVDSAAAPIPEAIANLWRDRTELPVSYVGYTATAAANLLQAADNDLYPEHFVYLLRYPSDENSALTIREPNPDSWYSGGQCFYEAFGDTPGLTSNYLVNASVSAADVIGTVETNESLLDAIRAYLVAGAYRLALKPGASFDDVANLPNPHTMLIQTSALMDEHERILRGISVMFGGERTPDGTLTLDQAKVMTDLDAHEPGWEKWYQEFSESRERIYLERPSSEAHVHASWRSVRDLISVVVQNVRAKSINSDPITGQSLDYSVRQLSDGTKQSPPDIYVIVVGGAKLSRGITLEGLCISYFTRWAPNPTEDTVLQISRWYGYRGKHLAFCRLFTTLAVFQSLTEIHENDRDLRFQLAGLMVQKKSPRDAGLVLRCSPRALPTGKIGVGRVFDLNFSPYQTVFRTVEIGDLATVNQDSAVSFVKSIRLRNPQPVTTDGGHVRGILSRSWLANEVADVVDSLSFSIHNPSLEGNPAGEFHRKPDLSRTTLSVLNYRTDPYQVASYLREWSARAEAGKASKPPLFDVGFAYGERTSEFEPFDFALLDRTITPEGKMIGEWTGRSGGWRGDALFDGPDANLLVAGSSLRGSGLRGLLLLYVIHKDARGRQRLGISRSKHTVTFGISIPGGGPELRRVAVTQNK